MSRPFSFSLAHFTFSFRGTTLIGVGGLKSRVDHHHTIIPYGIARATIPEAQEVEKNNNNKRN